MKDTYLENDQEGAALLPSMKGDELASSAPQEAPKARVDTPLREKNSSSVGENLSFFPLKDDQGIASPLLGKKVDDLASSMPQLVTSKKKTRAGAPHDKNLRSIGDGIKLSLQGNFIRQEGGKEIFLLSINELSPYKLRKVEQLIKDANNPELLAQLESRKAELAAGMVYVRSRVHTDAVTGKDMEGLIMRVKQGDKEAVSKIAEYWKECKYRKLIVKGVVRLRAAYFFDFLKDNNYDCSNLGFDRGELKVSMNGCSERMKNLARDLGILDPIEVVTPDDQAVANILQGMAQSEKDKSIVRVLEDGLAMKSDDEDAGFADSVAKRRRTSSRGR